LGEIPAPEEQPQQPAGPRQPRSPLPPPQPRRRPQRNAGHAEAGRQQRIRRHVVHQLLDHRKRAAPNHRYQQQPQRRPRRGHYSFTSRARSSSFTSFGLALPCVFFITWPTKKPSVFISPARTLAAASSFSAMTSSTTAASCASSLICSKPRSWTMAAADLPVRNISSKTSLAMVPLMTPLSIRPSSSASPCGVSATSLTSLPSSRNSRRNSTMIQLLTVFGLL